MSKIAHEADLSILRHAFQIQSQSGKRRSRYSPPVRDAARRLARQGLSVASMAKETGLPASVLYGWVRRFSQTSPAVEAASLSPRILSVVPNALTPIRADIQFRGWSITVTSQPAMGR